MLCGPRVIDLLVTYFSMLSRLALLNDHQTCAVILTEPRSGRELSLAAIFGARPIDTRSLLSLTPALTRNVSPQSMPVPWDGYQFCKAALLKSCFNMGAIIRSQTQLMPVAAKVALSAILLPTNTPMTLSP